MRRFSVVIPNYNYQAYVGAAIESALSSNWENLEVIVVDDGSSDNSRGVIEAFGDQIIAIFQANAGQREACNAGYSRSTGDVIIFLDSDDMLTPNAIREIDSIWTDRLSKVQVQLMKIDAQGRPTGAVFPRFTTVPDAASIAHWYRTTGAHPTPPGSGNAYARSFLQRVMPIGDGADEFIDSALLAIAPLFGDIATIPEALVRYRVHDANDSDLAAVPSRFDREVSRAVRRARWARAHCMDTDAPGLEELRRSRELLQFRVAARATTPALRSFPGDTDMRLLHDIARSITSPGPHAMTQRFAIMLWCLAAFIAPARLRPAFVQGRYGRR